MERDQRLPEDVRITYYGYNAFTIATQGKTVVLDPGQNLHWRRLDSLIPRRRWSEADLILVTHGDADHAAYVGQVAEASEAPIVCGPALTERWRRRGLKVVALGPGQAAEVADVPVEGVPVRHGGISVSLFGRTVSLKPPSVGEGAVGLLFTLEGRRLLNLGDTLLLEGVWRGLRPDVLMVPIGGMMTMDVDDALRAVTAIEPRIVIPMHYNWDILFYHRPADVARFAAAVTTGGRRCIRLQPGESAQV